MPGNPIENGTETKLTRRDFLKYLAGELGLVLTGGWRLPTNIPALTTETVPATAPSPEQEKNPGELELYLGEYKQITATPQDEKWVAVGEGGIAWTELSTNGQWDIILQSEGAMSPTNITEQFDGQNFAPTLVGNLLAFTTWDRQSNFYGYTVVNLENPTEPVARISRPTWTEALQQTSDKSQELLIERMRQAQTANQDLNTILQSLTDKPTANLPAQNQDLSAAQRRLDSAKTEQEGLLDKLVESLQANAYPNPALAYNELNDEYLLVVSDIDTGRIEAQRLNSKGEKKQDQLIALVEKKGYTPKVIIDEKGFTHLVYVDTSDGWRVKYHVYNNNYDEVISYDLALGQKRPSQFQPAIVRNLLGMTAIMYTARNGDSHWDTHLVCFTDADTDDNKARIEHPWIVATGQRDQIGQGLAASGDDFIVIYTDTTQLEREQSSNRPNWHLDTIKVNFAPATSTVRTSQPIRIFNNLVRWPLGAPGNLGAYMYRSALRPRDDNTAEVVAPLQDPLTGQIDLHRRIIELGERKQQDLTWNIREVAHSDYHNMFNPLVLEHYVGGDIRQPLVWWQRYSGESDPDQPRIPEVRMIDDIYADQLSLPRYVESNASLIQAAVCQDEIWIVYQQSDTSTVAAIKNPGREDQEVVWHTKEIAYDPAISPRFDRNGNELTPICAYVTEHVTDNEEIRHKLNTQILGSTSRQQPTEVNIPQHVTTVQNPRFGVDRNNGTLYLVFETENGIYVTFSETQGESWRKAKRISSTESRLAQEPEIAVSDDGTTVVTWVGKQNTDFGNVYAAISEDGVNWTAPILLNERPKERTCGPPAIAIRGNRAFIIYGDVQNKADSARRLWGFEPNCAVYDLVGRRMIGHYRIVENDPQDPTGIADLYATFGTDGRLVAAWGRKQRGRNRDFSLDVASGTIDPSLLEDKNTTDFKL